MTNGYPDPEAETTLLREELAEARQQLLWCDKPWDNAEGWERRIRSLEATLAVMAPPAPASPCRATRKR